MITDPAVNENIEGLKAMGFSHQADEFLECYCLAQKIFDIQSAIQRACAPRTTLLFPIRPYVSLETMRSQRDELYKRMKAFDFDTKCDVYDTLPLDKRSQIPLSVWNHGGDKFRPY